MGSGIGSGSGSGSGSGRFPTLILLPVHTQWPQDCDPRSLPEFDLFFQRIGHVKPAAMLSSLKEAVKTSGCKWWKLYF
jgi:hypothetical protein